jgi:GxxExxY protein
VKDIDEISSDVIAAAIHIHKELGPGLLEQVYQTILVGSLARSGYFVEKEKPIDIKFDGMIFPAAFRIDLMVDKRLIVEIKTIDRLAPVHAKQVLTYLRLTEQPVGLLLNFSGETMKEGIRRIVNNHVR